MSQSSAYPVKHAQAMQPSWKDIAKTLVETLKKGDLYEVTNLVSHIRTRTTNEKIEELIETGIMNQIIGFLDDKYFQQERLLVECSDILSYTTSTEDLESIIGLGVIPKSLKMLKYPNNLVKQNLLWLLANIAGDSLKNRDLLIEVGAVKQIVWLIKSCAHKASLISKVSWLISNLLRGKPYAEFNKINPLCKFVVYFLKNTKNKKIISNILWALSYLTDRNDGGLEQIFSSNICPNLVKLLRDSTDPQILCPTVRVIGNMLNEINVSEDLIRNGVLEAYSNLLAYPHEEIRREICWGLSNLLATNEENIQQVLEFNDGMILQKLVKMQQDEDSLIAKEALYGLANACLVAHIQQISQMINMGIISIFINYMGKENNDATLLQRCLEALDEILNKFEDPGFELLDKTTVLTKVEEADGINVLEQLKTHHKVSFLAAEILQTHFDKDCA